MDERQMTNLAEFIKRLNAIRASYQVHTTAEHTEVILPPDGRVFKFDCTGKLIEAPRGKKENE